MTVPGQENAEYRPLKSPEKRKQEVSRGDILAQSTQASDGLLGSINNLGGEPDITPSPPETDFEKQMQQIENRGGAIIKEASVLQGELQDLNKKAETLKNEGLKNREKVADYLGTLAKDLPTQNQHTDAIGNTLKNLPKYLTETDMEKIIRRARWDAARSVSSQEVIDTMSAENKKATQEEGGKKIESNVTPTIENSESQNPSRKDTEAKPTAPQSSTPLSTPSVNKVAPVTPESRVQPPIPPPPSAERGTANSVSVPPPVFANHGNVQTVEFGGWGDEKKIQPSPSAKPQNVVTPSISPQIVETTREDAPVPTFVEPQQPVVPPIVPGITETPEVSAPTPENDPPSERRKILGDNVSIGMTRGTNKILKNKTPNDEWVAVSERGTIYIGKDIRIRHDSEQAKNITGSDIIIRLDQEGYVENADNAKNGFYPLPENDLKKYVEYLNAMGVDCRMR